MNTVSRTIAGTALFILGLFIIVSTWRAAEGLWVNIYGAAWGLLILGVGIYVFFNKEEDKIEEIKNDK